MVDTESECLVSPEHSLTHKECGNFSCLRPQLIRNNLQGHTLRATLDTLVDEDEEGEPIEV